MSDWIEWKGGECPVPDSTMVEVRFRDGRTPTRRPADMFDWGYGKGYLMRNSDIVAYRVHHSHPVLGAALSEAVGALTGGKLTGNHYYRVRVAEPISPEVQPYTAECADIIEALDMTFNEGEAFKALWRLAASRQGRGKPGNKAQYDADKAAHYGARVAAQTKRGAG